MMAELTPAAQHALRYLLRTGAGDRQDAVLELVVYPRRHGLSHRDLLVLLDQYPLMTSWWREETCHAYPGLVDELVPGGLGALITLHPSDHWLALWREIAPVSEEAVGVTRTPIRTDAKGVIGAANSVLVLAGQGLIPDLSQAGR